MKTEYKDDLEIPGGIIELDESPKQAAKREVKEETAISIENVTLLDAIDYIKNDENEAVGYHYSLIDYMADYRAGDIMAGDDAIDAKWVSIDMLDAYNLWSETAKLIEKAIGARET